MINRAESENIRGSGREPIRLIEMYQLVVGRTGWEKEWGGGKEKEFHSRTQSRDKNALFVENE